MNISNRQANELKAAGFNAIIQTWAGIRWVGEVVLTVDEARYFEKVLAGFSGFNLEIIQEEI